MPARRRLGISTVAVLRAIDGGHGYGFEIMDVTDLPGGTVYPALARLEGDDLLRSRWEDPSIARREGRPSRRYYEITDSGRAKLAESLAWIAGVAPAPGGNA